MSIEKLCIIAIHVLLVGVTTEMNEKTVNIASPHSSVVSTIYCKYRYVARVRYDVYNILVFGDYCIVIFTNHFTVK